MSKRENYISWDEYFMGLAVLSAQRSKDPSTQVGACIVADDNTILSVGYNGFPKGCSDEEFPWGKESNNPNETKYPYVVHAELNAVLNANANLNNSKIYVTLFPCNECAKVIIQSGIKSVTYLNDINNTRYKDSVEATMKMFRSANIEYKRFGSWKENIILKLS